MKPRAPSVTCSRIEEYDDGEVVLQWHSFVVGEDFRKDEYSKANLMFIKADPLRITSDEDPRFSGDWRHHESMYGLPMIHWSKVATHFAGIRVNPANRNDMFPMWDVDTLQIWDTSCIEMSKTFENVGEWLYMM